MDDLPNDPFSWQASAGARLRRLLARTQPLVTPSVWDCLTARLLEEAGFEALSVSGSSVSVARLGVPDMSFAGLTDMVDAVRAVTHSVRAPVLADADTGYGDAIHAARSCRLLAEAGAAALHIEDQAFPKRGRESRGGAIIEVRDYIAKLRAVLKERPDPSFVVVARTDALPVEGIDAAIERANHYVAAGADAVLVNGPQTIKDVERIAQEVDATKVYNLSAERGSPPLTFDELDELGFHWITIPALALAGVLQGVRSMAAAVLAEQGSAPVTTSDFSAESLFALFGHDHWKAISAQASNFA